MKKKSELRIWAKEIRKNLDMEQISRQICSNLQRLDIYKQAKNVLIFYPLKTEVDLLNLLREDGNIKNFYLPRVKGEDLEVCPYTFGDKLELSELKIEEPLTEPVDKTLLDIVIAPALCADKRFYRLGYGKGYYDRFCADISAKCLVVIPESLVVDEIETDSHDVRCDGIITEKKASFLRG